MENGTKLAKIWDIWLNSLHFIGHPVWWKYTLNKYIYVFGTKGFPKAQPHKEKLFLESHISIFLAHFMGFSIFLDTLYGQNRLGISLSIYLGQKVKKNPPQNGKIFLKSKYIDWSRISKLLVNFMAFSIFRTPCMVKIHF